MQRHSRSREPLDRLLVLAKIALLGTAIASAMTLVPASMRAQKPTTATPRKATPTQLTLLNGTKDTVKIELRIGAATDCGLNPVAAVQLLPPGRSWLIATPRPICWRRTDAYQAAGGAGSWHRQVLAVGQRLELTL